MVDQDAFSGTWYSEKPERLTLDLEKLLTAAQGSVTTEEGGGTSGVGRIGRGAVLPHAGHFYSGRGIAPAFAPFLADNAALPKRFLIMAPSHYEAVPQDTVLLESFQSHATPIGDIRGDPRFSAELITRARGLPNIAVKTSNSSIQREHAVEMFFPFISHTAKDAYVNAALVGSFRSPAVVRELASVILDTLVAVDDDSRSTFVIASSDFTHHGGRFGYTPYGDLPAAKTAPRVREDDLKLARRAAGRDLDAFYEHIATERTTVCGRYAIMVLIAIEEIRGSAGVVADYYNSNDISGTHSNDYVCYATVLYE